MTVVAPRAGAWIETGWYSQHSVENKVAPRAGAWIETVKTMFGGGGGGVAPRAGAWIETHIITVTTKMADCRPPRGGVD